MNIANFFKKGEGDVVDLTRTPEKKRKADQLDTDTSPSPKKNSFLWPLSSCGSTNALDTKARRLTEWSAFARFGAKSVPNTPLRRSTVRQQETPTR